MNRFIIGRLGVLSLLTALFAAGCAFEQGPQDPDGDDVATDDSGELIAVDSDDDSRALPGDQALHKHSVSNLKNRPATDCASCGPLPEPWAAGPLPEPWSSPEPDPDPASGSSSSSSGSNGGAGSSDRH